MSAKTDAAQRKTDALRHALGPAVLEALEDPTVVEILANPDGRLIIERQGAGRTRSDTILSVEARERAIRLVADFVGEEVTPHDPRLAGVLPTGERFQGFMPPVSSGPTFAIRKRASLIWSLDDYVAKQIASAAQADVLRRAVETRRNILVCGGTGSGKTTLANALLAEDAFRNDRIFLIEDTPELQCASWDMVNVLSRRFPRVIGIGALVRDALRMRPDRIVVGEMRDGAAALETLKAWNTGHPGGLSTLHANTAADALLRLEDLLSEVASEPPRRLIAQAVQLIAFIRRDPQGRRLDGIVHVDGLDPDGSYRLSMVA